MIGLKLTLKYWTLNRASVAVEMTTETVLSPGFTLER